MKNLPAYDDFVNEAKDWLDFDTVKLAKDFAKKFKDKNSDAKDLEYWVDQYCYEKKIEQGPTEADIEDLIRELEKLGYKKIDIKDYPKPWYW